MISLIGRYMKICGNAVRLCSTPVRSQTTTSMNNFETVFSFPSIRYIALLNRLKLYHILGTTVAIPSSGILQMMDIFGSGACLATSYIGVTGAIVLTVATLPFQNIIGHIYINEDNSKIKISFLDFWGRRKDRIINVEEWLPLMEMQSKTSDAFYLTPTLTDGTTYKLPVKYGKVINAQKMGNVLE